jgi:hypothetical protein
MGEDAEAIDYDTEKVSPSEPVKDPPDMRGSRVRSDERIWALLIPLEQIFYHLVFYMDTPENAEKNGLASSDPPKAASERCVRYG